MSSSSRSLQTFNGVVGTLHLVQAVASAFFLRNKEARWPVVSRGGLKALHTDYYDLTRLVPFFPLLSTLNHYVAVAAPPQGVNVTRWLEYSASAGLMLWIIASLSGVVELRSLVQIVAMNAALQYVGYLVEKRKLEGQPVGDLLRLGFALHVLTWVPIAISFFTILESAEDPVPSAVYSIVPVMFALFTSFGVVQALYVQDKLTFERAEWAYGVLSLSAKSFLTWMVTFGVSRDRDDDEQNFFGGE